MARSRPHSEPGRRGATGQPSQPTAPRQPRPDPSSAQATARRSQLGGREQGCPGGCKPSRTLDRPLRRADRQKFPSHKAFFDIPSGHRIRHYGLLSASARKANLTRARELLAVAPPPDNDVPEEPLDDRPPCPCCGGHMIIIETFQRWRQPRAPPHCTPPTRRNSP